MAGKKHRQKGDRTERRIVHMLREAGIPARRVPLSGATEYAKGDVELYFHKTTSLERFDWLAAGTKWANARRAEVKARKKLPAWLLEWLGDNDCLFLVEDRKEPLVILRMSKFTELVG